MRAKQIEEAKKKLHMYAVIPARYAGRIGLAKWLNVHRAFPGVSELENSLHVRSQASQGHLCFSAGQPSFQAIEVKWNRQKIANLLKASNTIALVVGFVVVPVAILTSVIKYNQPISARSHFAGIFLSAASTLFLGCNTDMEALQAEKLRRARLSRFVAAFSHIETLVLEGFTGSMSTHNSCNNMVLSLGKIHITRMECTRDAYDFSTQ